MASALLQESTATGCAECAVFETGIACASASVLSGLARGLLSNAFVTVYRSPVAGRVIGCAIEVHKQIGPGLLESAYHSCLTREFTLNALRFSRDVSVPILYKGSTVDCAYRADFVVEDELLLELKSVDRMQPIHQAQLLTYMRLLKLHQGLLINFNVSRLVEGVRSQLL